MTYKDFPSLRQSISREIGSGQLREKEKPRNWVELYGERIKQHDRGRRRRERDDHGHSQRHFRPSKLDRASNWFIKFISIY
jgi:hypothetical protein